MALLGGLAGDAVSIRGASVTTSGAGGADRGVLAGGALAAGGGASAGTDAVCADVGIGREASFGRDGWAGEHASSTTDQHHAPRVTLLMNQRL